VAGSAVGGVGQHIAGVGGIVSGFHLSMLGLVVLELLTACALIVYLAARLARGVFQAQLLRYLYLVPLAVLYSHYLWLWPVEPSGSATSYVYWLFLTAPFPLVVTPLKIECADMILMLRGQGHCEPHGAPEGGHRVKWLLRGLAGTVVLVPIVCYLLGLYVGATS